MSRDVDLIRAHIARWAAAPGRDTTVFAYGPDSYRDPRLLTETVVAVLDENERMAAELEQVRGDRGNDTAAVAKVLIALHDVKLPLLVGLAVAELEDTFLPRLARHVAPEAFARFEAELAKRDDAAETAATRPADGLTGTSGDPATDMPANGPQRPAEGDTVARCICGRLLGEYCPCGVDADHGPAQDTTAAQDATAAGQAASGPYTATPTSSPQEP